MKGTRRVGAHDVQPACGHSAYTRCGHVVRGENFFFKKNVLRALQTLPPLSSKGFRNIHQLLLHNMHGSAWVGRHWQQWPGIDSGVLCP